MTYYLLHQNYVICLVILVTFFDDVRVTLLFSTFEICIEIILAYSACFIRYMLAYSIMLSIIQAYSCLLRHYQGIPRLTQTYSDPHIKQEPYLKPCKTLTRHIQNLAIGHDSAIFSNIQNLAQKPGILGILEYSKPFHHCILTHIQNPVMLAKIYEYSEL